MDQAALNIIVQLKDGATKVAENIKGGIGGIGDKVVEVGKTAQAMGKQLAAGLAVGGAALTVFAKQSTDFTVDYVKSTKQIARETGTTVESASQLVFALKRAGIQEENISTVFSAFSKNIVENNQKIKENIAASGALNSQIEATQFKIKAVSKEMHDNGDATGALGIELRGLQANLVVLQGKLTEAKTPFQRLGVVTTTATGEQRDFKDILLDVADKFKQMPGGVDRTALALELFGKQGKGMISILSKGSEGITDLTKQADALGLTLNEKTIGAVDKYVESQKRLKENTDAIKLAVGNLTTPILSAYNEKLAELVGKFQTLNPEQKALTANVLAFGGPVAGAAGAVIGFLSNLSSLSPKILEIMKFASLWAVIIGIVAVALFDVSQKVGGWQAVLERIKPFIEQVHKAFSDMLSAIMPSVDALKNTLQNDLLPALRNIWAVVSPILLPILGALAVMLSNTLWLAVYGIINAVNGLIKVFKDHKVAVAAVAGALLALLIPVLAMLITVTIPALITGFVSMAVAGWAAIAPWLPFILIGAAIGVIAYEIVAHWQTVKDFFIGVWNWIKGNWPLLLDVLFGPFGYVVGLIIQNWNGILNFFRELPGKIGAFFVGLANTIIAPYKFAFNEIAKFWNSTVGNLSFKAPSWVPGMGGKGWSVPKIPMLAEGGIATRATLAMIGEGNQPEAVLPLNRLEGMMESWQRRLMQGGSGTAQMAGASTVNNYGDTYVQLNTAEAVREYYKQNGNDNELIRNGLTARRGQ